MTCDDIRATFTRVALWLDTVYVALCGLAPPAMAFMAVWYAIGLRYLLFGANSLVNLAVWEECRATTCSTHVALYSAFA